MHSSAVAPHGRQRPHNCSVRCLGSLLVGALVAVVLLGGNLLMCTMRSSSSHFLDDHYQDAEAGQVHGGGGRGRRRISAAIQPPVAAFTVALPGIMKRRGAEGGSASSPQSSSTAVGGGGRGVVVADAVVAEGPPQPAAGSDGEGPRLAPGTVNVRSCPSGPRSVVGLRAVGVPECSGHGVCGPTHAAVEAAGNRSGAAAVWLDVCECDDGWEGYSCDVPLRELLADGGGGTSYYAAYAAAKAKDAIYPKEAGPSPAGGNQYIPKALVGRVLRPITPLPILASCGGDDSSDGGRGSAADCNAGPVEGVGRLLTSLEEQYGMLTGGTAIHVIVVLVGRDVPKALLSPKGRGKGKGCHTLGASLAALGLAASGNAYPLLASAPPSVCVSAVALPSSLLTTTSPLAGTDVTYERQSIAIAHGMNVGLAWSGGEEEEVGGGGVAGHPQQQPFGLLVNVLAVDVVHEHTNLELAVSQMLTTSVDVLGFQSLFPTAAAAASVPAASLGAAQQQHLYVPECWDLALSRWVLRRSRPLFGYRRHERYTMYCDASALDMAAVVVRRAAPPPSSRGDDGVDGERGVGLLDASVGSMAMADLYLRIKYDVNARAVAQHPAAPPSRAPGYVLVGTCAECLLRRTSDAYHRSAVRSHNNAAFSNKHSVEAVRGTVFGDGDGSLVPSEPFTPPSFGDFHHSVGGGSSNSGGDSAAQLLAVISELFLTARSAQFPAKGGSSGKVQPAALTMSAVTHRIRRLLEQLSARGGGGGGGRATEALLPALLDEEDALVRQQVVACARSGGIYGPSKDGRFASYCQRLQRRRDFLLIYLLWTTPTLFQKAPVDGGKGGRQHGRAKERRYAVSLHAGNLFGALRIGKELLWETDGDFDLVALDDTHEELVARFARMLAYLGGHSKGSSSPPHPFTIKPSEDGKPWYASVLRDSVDFQLNARSAIDPRTRGRPPHIHNVSVMYEGVRVFVNGFQNPWQGVRSAPGHDYRRLYLAQQKWTPNRHHVRSIECASAAMPANSSSGGTAGSSAALCMPPCNTPFYRIDHGYCDVIPPLLQSQLHLLDASGRDVV